RPPRRGPRRGGPPTPAPTPVPAPAPAAYGYPHQPPEPAYRTSAPYGTAAAGSGRRSTPLLVGAIVVALIAVTGVITAVALHQEDGPSTPGAGTTQSSVTTGTEGGDYQGPDLSKRIDTTKCTEPDEGDDPEKFKVPDFRYKNITSVKECIQAAGWKIVKEVSVDENVYGDGTVLTQYPPSDTEINADEAGFTLEISTGRGQQ
ncbi:PASTA domain-containing protein, partial [Streptomyces sp. Act-28]